MFRRMTALFVAALCLLAGLQFPSASADSLQLTWFDSQGNTIHQQIIECDPHQPAAEIQPVPEEHWINNILMEDPFDILRLEKEKIRTVTFLDSTESAPRRPWSLGRDYSARVLGWVEWVGGFADVYFAADGGINAEACCAQLFKGCENLEEIRFNGAFHTDYVTSMYEMFRDCRSLEELDVSGFNTSRCTDMYCMFSTCTQLKSLDLSGFDTGKVTNMGFMFSACRKLKTLEVGGFDTGRVYNMSGMFRWCEKLACPDVSGWDFSRVLTADSFMDPGIRVNGQHWEALFR